MKKAETFIRIALGVLILISGVNKFGYWINVEHMQDAIDFALKLINVGAGFLIYALAILEIFIGIALIINKFKTLAILALLPLIVAIVTFHLLLDLQGILMAAIVFGLELALLYINKDKVSSIFAING